MDPIARRAGDVCLRCWLAMLSIVASGLLYGREEELTNRAANAKMLQRKSGRVERKAILFLLCKSPPFRFGNSPNASILRKTWSERLLLQCDSVAIYCLVTGVPKSVFKIK